VSPAPRVLPDVEAVLIGWLAAQLGDAALCVRDIPEDLQDAVPVVQVLDVTGIVAGNARIHATATIDVNAYAGGGETADADACALGRQVEALLLATRNLTTAGAVVQEFGSVVRPRKLPYVNTAVILYGATYTLRLHPAPAAA